MKLKIREKQREYNFLKPGALIFLMYLFIFLQVPHQWLPFAIQMPQNFPMNPLWTLIFLTEPRLFKIQWSHNNRLEIYGNFRKSFCLLHKANNAQKHQKMNKPTLFYEMYDNTASFFF